MGIFDFLKKKKAEKCLTYEQFNEWADNTLSLTIPKEVVAFCFNIYDDGDNKWSIELVGAGSFDKNNSDWACDEVCVNRDNPLMWKCNESWDVALAQVRDVVLRYLKEGKYSHILKSSKVPLYLRTANSYDGKGCHRIFIPYFQLLIQINQLNCVSLPLD